MKNGKMESPEKDAVGCPSCSQSAHDETVLVRCAQRKISQPPIPWRENEQAWRAHNSRVVIVR